MHRLRSRALGGLAAGVLVAGLAGGASAQSQEPGMMADGLDGTTWQLGNIGDQPLASYVEITLVFAAGEAGGNAGCNQYFASYETDGTSTLSFGPIGATMRLCDEAVDTLEQSYLAALGTVASYTMDADGLALADAGATAVLSFISAAPASVEGAWGVSQVSDGSGSLVPVSAEVVPTVTFGPDGLVHGFGGCNDFSGGYSVDGDTIAIGPLMSTLQSCGEAIDTAESAFLAALDSSVTWSVSGETLTLADANGVPLVEAMRAVATPLA